jgi:dynein intermediate chain 2, axonemal
MSTKYSSSYLTDGCWSPVRPSVFFTAKMDGTVDIWDYLFKQTEATHTIQVSTSPLHSVKVQEHGKLVAISARDGSMTLLELSDGLSKIQNNEKKIFSEMLDRELKREKTLESAVREKRIKASQKRPNSAIAPTGTILEELLKQAEDDFFSYIDDGSGEIKDAALARAREFDGK